MNRDQAIPDDKLQKLLNVLYNLYFNKWKRRMVSASDQERRQCIEELDSIPPGRSIPYRGSARPGFLHGTGCKGSRRRLCT